jgi:DnaJ-like protein
MSEAAERYPLSWPSGWKRTPGASRLRARFRAQAAPRYNAQGQVLYGGMRDLTVSESLGRLQRELDRLGARDILVSTNIELRLDGLPRSGRNAPEDPGAAVYFKLKGKPRCLACDKWQSVADNLASIAAHVEALRAIDRYGVGTLDQAFAGYTQLPAAPVDWWIVLGIPASSGPEEIDRAYKALARKHHPDVGGDPSQMARLNQARDLALQERCA